MANPLRTLLRSPRLFPRLMRWLLAFLVLIAALQFATILFLQRRFLEQTFQVINADLAHSLAEQLRPHIHDDALDMGSLGELLAQFQRHGPMHGYYLLNGRGEILLTSVERIKLHRPVVPTEPLELFLTSEGGRKFPIYGVDPLQKERMVPFSAAKLREGTEPLYLYITLHSKRTDMLFLAIIDREAPVLATVTFIAAVAFAAAASLLFSLFFVRRLERLRRGVERFGAGDSTVRSADSGEDELAFLSTSFNGMADTISAQMREIREQEETRRELVQNICHDLRTPLTAARGYLETLEIRKERLTEEERERYLGIIDANLGFMQTMAEELFDLASLEANDRPLDERRFDLVALAEELVEKFHSSAERSEIALRLERGSESVSVIGDRALLERAATNLIQNAIRYTPPSGTVVVKVVTSNTRARFSVRDTGIGIAVADQGRIFGRFYRTDRARMMNAKGSGLGLAIVKRILELHRSDVELESDEGKGSEFGFSLPLA